MDSKVCSQCGAELESMGVQFKDKVFCSDECCDEFEEQLSGETIPALEELEEGEDKLLAVGDDLGYRDEADLDDDDLDADFDEFAMDDGF
jgi:hypothetical protein